MSPLRNCMAKLGTQPRFIQKITELKQDRKKCNYTVTYRNYRVKPESIEMFTKRTV